MDRSTANGSGPNSAMRYPPNPNRVDSPTRVYWPRTNNSAAAGETPVSEPVLVADGHRGPAEFDDVGQDPFRDRGHAERGPPKRGRDGAVQHRRRMRRQPERAGGDERDAEAVGGEHGRGLCRPRRRIESGSIGGIAWPEHSDVIVGLNARPNRVTIFERDRGAVRHSGTTLGTPEPPGRGDSHPVQTGPSTTSRAGQYPTHRRRTNVCNSQRRRVPAYGRKCPKALLLKCLLRHRPARCPEVKRSERDWNSR